MTHISPTLLTPSVFIWLDLGVWGFVLPILVCSHPLTLNHSQTPGSSIPMQQGFVQERASSNTTSKPMGHHATKNSHCSCAWPSPGYRGKEILPAGGWFRENGAEEHLVAELEFPFPTYPCLRQPSSAKTHISLKKHTTEAMLSWLSLRFCQFYHVKAENKLFHQPLNQEQKIPGFLHNDPEVISSRLAVLTWNRRIQITFQCKYQLR